MQPHDWTNPPEISPPPPPDDFIRSSILHLDTETADLEKRILDAAVFFQNNTDTLTRLRTETQTAKSTLDYIVMELRTELFALASPRKKKAEPDEMALPNAIITGTSAAEREAQFEHYLKTLERQEPSSPYAAALRQHHLALGKEETKARDLKEQERLLSALRTVADLKAARLLALAALVRK